MVKAKTDPDKKFAPVKPKSAFIFFTMERRKQLRASNPELKSTEISKRMMEEWSRMKERDKDPYHDLAAKDKDRYLEEKQKGKVGWA